MSLSKLVLRSRSRIILVKPEPQRDAALALAPNMIFNIGKLSKMSQTTV
jgi:hypothetical protein